MRFALVAMLIACRAPQHAPGERADLVLAGGRVFTGDPERPWARTIAIRGDRIIALDDEAERLGTARRIELGGKLVIPGINDAHVHEPALGDFVDVAEGFDTLTVNDIVTGIERGVREQPAGTWLRAELSRAAVDDPRLTRELLDRLAPAHPLWIDNGFGHVVVLNTVAERRLGLTARVPTGGYIGRNGWRFEYARYEAMRRRGTTADDATIADALDTFENTATSFGITSVQTFPLDVDAEHLARIAAQHDRRLRWRIVRVPIGEVVTPTRARVSDPTAYVTLAGTKYFFDGMLAERGAALAEPYADAPASGRLDWTRDDIRQMLEAARASGDQLHVHVAGDRSVRVVLDVIDEIGGSWLGERVVLEHGDGLVQADYARAKRLGVIVVQNPSHSMTAALDRARLGDRASHWMPMRSLVAAGIPFALGSDGPLNPFLNILFATRHPTNPGEALTREQALVAYTQGAAFDERTEAAKGRLVPGMLADLAVLSQDLFTVPDEALPATRSVLTIVGGRIVFER